MKKVKTRGTLSGIIFTLAMLISFVPGFAITAKAAEREVYTYEQLKAAVEDPSIDTIIVGADIDVPCETAPAPEDKLNDTTGKCSNQLVIDRNLTLKSKENTKGIKYVLKRVPASGATASNLKSVIGVKGNGTGGGESNRTSNTIQVSLTNIIIDGGADFQNRTLSERMSLTGSNISGRAILDVFYGGTLNLEDGVEIRNGHNSNSVDSCAITGEGTWRYGGAVRVDWNNETGAGTVNLKSGAVIHDCSAGNPYGNDSVGGALGSYTYSCLNVYGGEIYNCSAGFGGGIGCTRRKNRS